MEEVSGTVQKVSTHASNVGVDVATVENDCATVNVDTTSFLPEGGKNGTPVKSKHPIAAMGWFHGVESGQLTFCEHTRESYIACQQKRAPHRGDGKGLGGVFGGVLQNAHKPLCWSGSGTIGRSRCHR